MATCAKSVLALTFLSVLACAANAQLRADFYSKSCPNVTTIVRLGMEKAVKEEKRMGASILRLFFHDAFVNGCDGSILLDDIPGKFTGEKGAGPNANSVRGYVVIDDIKTEVEKSCKKTVSCADILALAARDGVNLLGGPTWTVLLGRKDSRTADPKLADSSLPGPDSSLSNLESMFKKQGFNAAEMTALSGAHTIGRAQCRFCRNHIYNDPNINSTFAANLKKTCPRQFGNDNILAPFDVQSPDKFDNAYYQNLVTKRGLLHSDQELYNNGSQDALVSTYSTNATRFTSDFIAAMVKMGNLKPTGTVTEIRLNCRKAN